MKTINDVLHSVNDITLEDFYKRHMAFINKSVTRASISELNNYKEVLLLGTNAVNIQYELIQRLKNENADVKLDVIAQTTMLDKACEKGIKFDRKILWTGDYTLEMIRTLKNNFSNKVIDAFIFFSKEPINATSMNLYQISDAIYNEWGSNIYSYDTRGNIYRYDDPDFLYVTLSLYICVNKFICKVFR